MIPDSEIPYTIPSNWMWLRLQDIGIYSGGKTPSMANKEYWSDGSVPWITSKDMKQKYLSTSEMLISNAAAQELTIYPEKTVLFVVRSGILRRSFPVAILTQKGTINQDLKALRLYEPAMCEYVYYLLKGFETTILFQYAKDGTTVNNIVFDALLTMPIPIPPRAEQNRIVEKVQTIFALLDSIDTLQSQYQENLATLKSKIIDAGIQGKLTEQLPEDGTAEELYQQIQKEKLSLEKACKIKKSKPLPPISDEEKPFDIPENWKCVRIGGIATAIYAGGDKPRDFSKVKDNTHLIPVVGNGVENEGILGYTGKPTAKAYTVTVAGRGTIGFSVFRKYEYCPVVRLIVIEQNANIDPRYIQYVLQALPESGVGSSIPQLTVPMLTPKVIPLPPLAEQKRIVAKLEELLPLCEG